MLTQLYLFVEEKTNDNRAKIHRHRYRNLLMEDSTSMPIVQLPSMTLEVIYCS